MAVKRTATVTVRKDTHQAVTMAAVNAGPRVGRRVTMDALIVAAVRLAERHPDELDALLVEDPAVQVEGGAA